mgnify:CR=1 FL=1|tara:strand:- start:352 stop:570 length:219 start_codon:yes stop_codon:yes gene_type:complete
MTFKSKAIKLIMDKISDVNIRIRKLEDESKKFSVAPSSNGVYIGLVGYREALQDILSEIRSLNENVRSNRDI